MKTKLTPLEELRQEKTLIRRECAESEGRLAGHWEYLSDNAGSLLFQSAINIVLKKFGFGTSSKSKKDAASTSNNLLAGLTTYYPVLWELAQPLIWRFVVKKIKSIFSRNKKKKRKDDDD